MQKNSVPSSQAQNSHIISFFLSSLEVVLNELFFFFAGCSQDVILQTKREVSQFWPRKKSVQNLQLSAYAIALCMTNRGVR